MVEVATAMDAEEPVPAVQIEPVRVEAAPIAHYAGKPKDEVAAIKIQTAFRGYLVWVAILIFSNINYFVNYPPLLSFSQFIFFWQVFTIHLAQHSMSHSIFIKNPTQNSLVFIRDDTTNSKMLFSIKPKKVVKGQNLDIVP